MNYENITIRSMTNTDEAAVCEFFDAMGGESRAFFNRMNTNRKHAVSFCQTPSQKRRYFIAELDGKAVGLVFFLDWNTKIPELGVAVRDEYQGNGIGKKLVRFAVDLAKESDKGGIILTTHIANIRAQALYEELGFSCLGTYKNAKELIYILRYTDAI